jgi:16S rRNA G1207 methylase RsmC
LQAEGIYGRVFNQDFFTLSPDVTGLYDRVVMNPPFDWERDIDHVMHALKFLKEDGFLTAIVSAGTEFRETKNATAFREHMKKLNARWIDHPASSFASVGTNVNTIILRVWKSGRRW